MWKSDDPAYPRIDVYGSIADLERDFGVTVSDLHRPFVDDLVRPNPDDPTGTSMMRPDGSAIRPRMAPSWPIIWWLSSRKISASLGR